MSTLIKLVTEPPPRLKSMDPTVSDALDEAVAKALAMDPAARWPTATAFAKALIGAVGLADAEDVASYVRESAGPKIEQRREQIRAMGTLRAKIGEITEASEHTPSGNQVRAPPTEVEVRAPPPADVESSETKVDVSEGSEGDATEVVSGVAFPSAAAVSPDPAEPTAIGERATPPPDPVASADSAASVRRAGPPRWALPLVAGVTGLGVLLLLVAAVTRHTGEDASSKAHTSTTTLAQPPLTATTAAPISRSDAPSVTVDSPKDTETATVSAALPVASTVPSTVVAVATAMPAPTVSATTVATAKATPTTVVRPKPTTSKLLAPSPY